MLIALGAWSNVSVAEGWKLDPPAGWPELAGVAEQMRDGVGSVCGATLDAKAWAAPDGGTSRLMMFACVVPGVGTPYRRLIDALDRAWIPKLAAKTNTKQESEKPERVEGSLVIRDAMIANSRGRMRVLRIYQPADDGLHLVLAMCAGFDTSGCDASLDSADLVVASPVGLDAVRGTPLEEKLSLREVLGGLIFFVLLIMVHRWWRSQSEPRGSATAPLDERTGSDA